MADQMTPERPRCGTPCLKHAHACDRSPRHTGFHRDVQQKGDHTCEWDTPGPKDFPAVMAALRTAHAELAQRCDRDDCERFREWLSGEKAEADKRARQAEAERDEARAALAAADKLAAGLRGEVADVRAELDRERAERRRSDELLVGAHNDLCEALGVRHRPLLDVIQHAATVRAERDHLKDERGHAYTVLRGVLHGTPATLRQGVELAAKTIRDHDAERDRLAEQVKRATDVRLIRFAIADPGAFVKRERFNDGDYETVPAWGARAVVLAVQNGGEQRG